MSTPSDHWNGRRFFNPHQGGRDHGDIREVAKWMATRDRKRWRTIETPHGPPPPERVTGGGVRVTWVGHATALVQVAGLNLLTDPIWAHRCGPLSRVGPRRFRRAALRREDLPPIDAVLLSHDHYDHLCVETLRFLRDDHAPRIFTGLRVGEILAKHRIPGAVELDWWDSAELAPGVRVTFTPAQHFSGRGVHDRDRTLWGGLFVDTPAGGVFYAGDTGYGPHFREIRERLGAPRLALLPIGAYAPRWFMSPVHMDPAEAVRAHQELGAETSVAVHFASFALADDGQFEPERDLAAALAETGVSPEAFRVLEHGVGADIPAELESPAPGQGVVDDAAT